MKVLKCTIINTYTPDTLSVQACAQNAIKINHIEIGSEDETRYMKFGQAVKYLDAC